MKSEELNRYKYYEAYFKKLLLNNGEKLISEFIRAHNIKSCSFHGLTEISRLFTEWFRKNNVKVSYIVEDVKNIKEYEGIPLVSRQCVFFPVTDCMIICDLHIELVRGKLERLGYTGFVTDHNELIK